MAAPPAATNVPGTSGGQLFGIGRVLVPTCLSVRVPNGASHPGNGTYLPVDDPNTTPGASPTTIMSATSNPFLGFNKPAVTVSLTTSGSVPGAGLPGLGVARRRGTAGARSRS